MLRPFFGFHFKLSLSELGRQILCDFQVCKPGRLQIVLEEKIVNEKCTPPNWKLIHYEGGFIDGMHAVSLYCRNHSIYSTRHTLVSKLCEMSPLLGNVPLNSYRNCGIASSTLPLLFMHANAPLVFDGQTVTPTGVLPQPKQRDHTCSSHTATAHCEPIEYLVYNFQKEHANPQHVQRVFKSIFLPDPVSSVRSNHYFRFTIVARIFRPCTP